MEVSAKIVCKN